MKEVIPNITKIFFEQKTKHSFILYKYIFFFNRMDFIARPKKKIVLQ